MTTVELSEAQQARTIYGRVHAVLKALPAIGKNSHAPPAMGGYPFRGIEEITAALKPLLAQHGVFMVPSVIERRDSSRQTKGGSVLYVTDLLVRFTFYGIAGDSFSAELWGEGSDAGDKATQKAVTSAFKSMLAVTFCISDADTDTEAHVVPETKTRRPPAGRAPADGAPGGGPVSRPTDPPPEHVSGIALHDQQAKVKALQAHGVSVADERKKRHLPLLDDKVTEDEFGRWKQMLAELDRQVTEQERPFTERAS